MRTLIAPPTHTPRKVTLSIPTRQTPREIQLATPDADVQRAPVILELEPTKRELQRISVHASLPLGVPVEYGRGVTIREAVVDAKGDLMGGRMHAREHEL